MWLPLILALTCLFVSTPRVAQGADQHVLGTITAITPKRVEVKTSKGQVDVAIDNRTRYRDQHNPRSATLPEVGDRVIIVATKNEKKGARKGDPMLLATEVHFSAGRRAPIPIELAPVE